MRKKRAALICALGVVLVMLLPVGSYCYFAFVRHEHFYYGYPTSYWERAVRRWRVDMQTWPRPKPSYFDKLLAYLEDDEGPAVLSGDKAAVPVLMDLIWSDDTEVASTAAGRLAGDFTLRTVIGRDAFVWTNWFCIGGHPVRVQVENRECVVLPLGHRDALCPCNIQRFLLLDRRGKRLDSLVCDAGSRSGFLRTEEQPVDTQGNGTQFVIHYCPSEGQKPKSVSCKFIREVTNGRYSEKIELEDWEQKGICRIAVRNGKFEVLWPPRAEK
jgi:hypothetical protein